MRFLLNIPLLIANLNTERHKKKKLSTVLFLCISPLFAELLCSETIAHVKKKKKKKDYVGSCLTVLRSILPPCCFETTKGWQLERPTTKWPNQTNRGNDTFTSNRLRQRVELQTEPSGLISVGSSQHRSLVKLDPESTAWRRKHWALIAGCRSRG